MKRIDLAASIWALFAFAISQPLLDLLGRNPGFFLARGATRGEIVLIAVVLMLVIPAALAALVALARSVPLAGLAIHGVLFVTAAAILGVAVSDDTAATVPGWVKIAIGLVVALAAWAIFMTWRPMRTTFRFAAVGPPIFLALFLFFSPSSSLLLGSDSGGGPAAVAVGKPGPLVMILFDEFPVASIIDSQGEILDEVYPNLARLAEDGIWFRNAVSVEQQTEHSSPAILTGRRPTDRDALPTAGAYPANLFSLLGATFEVRAVESVTEMCPQDVCSTGSRVTRPPLEGWESLVQDLAVVSGHLFLPSDLTTGLPPISHTWGGFVPDDYDIVERFNEHVADDRRLLVERFLDLLERPSARPTLYYAHLLVPHIPWTYLPTGQRFREISPAPGSTPTGWGDDEWLVMQAYQRHLIQVQYADAIVGQVVDILKRKGEYRDATIVIVADHGTADVPGVGHRRVITPKTVGHVAAVPLFVKLPGEQRSGIDDYRAETIDILPTIADVLDVSVPWQMDGISLIGLDRPERTESTMSGPKGDVTFDVDGDEKLAVAAMKMKWFPSGDPFSLSPSGHAALLGMEMSNLEIEDGELTATIDDPEQYRDVDLEADPFPARLSGVVRRETGFEGDVVLAVSLNGRIEAVVRSYDTRDGMTKFQAMLPPEAFRAGSNDIELVLVPERGSGSSLVRIDLPGV